MPPEKTPRASPTEPRRRRLRRRRGTESADHGFDELRRTLLGPERSRIDLLEDRPAVSAPSVSAVLPEAIAAAEADQDEALAVALEPSVTRAVATVARRRPELYGEILAPTIGKAVRKAVRDAFAAVLERFDQALERSLSIEGVRWRIEAARTGRPLAEVVLHHTLEYRVEQAFLIHTRTSLVLQHVIDPVLEPSSPDQIAAMLAAIDAFGREAFGATAPEAHLEEFKTGELTVYLARDPSITLAAVVRGTPAVEISARLTDALARVHVACRAELAAFVGDVAPFEAARPVLEPLLRMKRRPPPRHGQVLLLALGALCAAALAGVVAWTTARREADARRLGGALAALEAEPGIVVTSAELTDGRVRLSGLRDPLAEAPAPLLASRGIGPATADLAPFVSLDPEIVRRRAERVLGPPRGVELALADGTLRAVGVAPRAWIDEARSLARALPGVERYADQGLRSREALDAVRAAAARLEATTIPFDRDDARVEGRGRELQVASERARAALSAAAEARLGAWVEVVGHADASGPSEHNLALSARRASAVAGALLDLGVAPRHVRAVGVGARGAGPRAVTLRLVVDPGRLGAGALPRGGTP